MDSLTILYRLANFNTLKTAETESKSALQTYLNMGYKLVTVSYLTTKEYLEWATKK